MTVAIMPVSLRRKGIGVVIKPLAATDISDSAPKGCVGDCRDIDP